MSCGILKIVKHSTIGSHKNDIDNSFHYSPHFSDIFASIAPVAASPLLGYGDLPGSPLSIIDLHGTRDTVVPNTLTQALGSYKDVTFSHIFIFFT